MRLKISRWFPNICVIWIGIVVVLIQWVHDTRKTFIAFNGVYITNKLAYDAYGWYFTTMTSTKPSNLLGCQHLLHPHCTLLSTKPLERSAHKRYTVFELFAPWLQMSNLIPLLNICLEAFHRLDFLKIKSSITTPYCNRVVDLFNCNFPLRFSIVRKGV